MAEPHIAPPASAQRQISIPSCGVCGTTATGRAAALPHIPVCDFTVQAWAVKVTPSSYKRNVFLSSSLCSTKAAFIKQHTYIEGEEDFFIPFLEEKKKNGEKNNNCQSINSAYTGGQRRVDLRFSWEASQGQMQLPTVCGSLSDIFCNVHDDTEISFPQPSNMKYCILLAFWGSRVFFFFFLSRIHCLLWLLKYLFRQTSLPLSPSISTGCSPGNLCDY